MRVGILVAMQEEIRDLLTSMRSVEQAKVGQKIIYTGKLYDSEVALCLCGVGKVNAAMSVGVLKAKHDVDAIVMTGLAGSASPKVRVGDIVISTEFIQHDVDSRPNFSRFVVPFTKGAILTADPMLSRLATDAGEHLADTITTKMDAALLAEFGIEKPAVHCGLIGTGDKFVADTAVLNELNAAIQADFGRPLLCVEMEGAAVAQSCVELGIACVAVRVISDCPYLEESVTDYHRFKQKIAAPYCDLVLADLLPAIESHLKK